MKALRFRLSGKTGFFKQPDVNTYLYYTYAQIHRIALLGLLGAIVGYKGYNEKGREKYPEFYKKLKDLKISIVSEGNDGIFDKKLQIFNNSTAFASNEEGGNLIVKQVWLENPSWLIYIFLDNDQSKLIKEYILDKKTILVTGAAGFIGSNLVKRIYQEAPSATVIGIDNMNAYYDVALKEFRLNELAKYPTFTFVKGNIADKELITELFEKYKREYETFSVK